MTCEIAIMNRYAVALAADSALTVRRWVKGEEEVRYFKGANKIFQLSDHHPVGLMIFNSSELQEVPWEIIIKDFRGHLGRKGCRNIKEYAEKIFDFIQSHDQLFPADYQSQIFRREVDRIATTYILHARSQKSIQEAKNKTQQKAKYKEFFDELLEIINETELPNIFTDEEIDSALVGHKSEIEAEINVTLEMVELKGIIDLTQVSELAVKTIFKKYDKYLSSTGLVIAGYGDDNYFPSFIEYDCYGLLLGKLLYSKKKNTEIGSKRQSDVESFARSEMVSTFMMGFSPDVFAYVNTEFGNGLQKLVTNLRKRKVLASFDEEEQVINGIGEEFKKKWMASAFDAHYNPLARVVGALPVDEMAELAETLIMLESLKAKVTFPTETVSGPIDVAVISKADGFIWIKRKHYFDSNLNPRFFLKQQENYTA